jgi:hypothetical protein
MVFACFASVANDRVQRIFAALGLSRVIAILVVLISSTLTGQAGSDIILDGGASSRDHIVYSDKLAPPVVSGALPEAYGKYLSGWAEFDFTARVPGWRKFDVDVKPFLGATRFRLDPRTGDRSLWLTPREWVWISAGTHVLRVEQTNWTGFTSIRSLSFKVASSEDGPAFRLLRPITTSFLRGQCPKLEVEVGGTANPFTLQKHVGSNDGSETTTSISVDPSEAPRRLLTELPCVPGDYRLALAPSQFGRAFPAQIFEYTVFGADRVEPKFVKGRLLDEIDLTAAAPDFASEATSVESGATGSYRVSESHGFTWFQRLSPAQRGNLSPPSWFAYRVRPPVTARPYILEVEYPDNAARAFVVAVRAADRPSLSFAIETGVIWPLSEKMARNEALFWASSSDMRVIVMNEHDGLRAAVAKIRLYDVEETTRPIIEADPKSVGSRDFRVWDEEGETFKTVVGVMGGGNRVFEAVDRWLREAKFFGATSVSPTASVYGSQMYPSSLLSTFSPPPDHDLLRAMLLDAERYGLRVMPQMSPRADEILTGLAKPDSRLLVSRTGQMRLFGAKQAIERPPYYNALDPVVQDWYVAVIGELADRYQNYPAFEGVDLRIMAWSNAALNNLVSLDWGYDASTVAQFAGENGLTFPAELTALGQDDSVIAPRRYDFIMRNHREAWIDWRCRKIYDLLVRLRDRVKSANPRLRLGVTIFTVASSPNGPPGDRDLKEAGLDISLIGKLSGLELIDGVHSYGNKEGGETWLRRFHDQLMDEKSFLEGPDQRRGPSVMVGMQYIEAVAGIVGSKDLGFPPQAKEFWVSAASNPPGRMRLERFATVLGETDAAMLGDGGNGYVFGSDVEREFLARYRLLPATRFHRVASESDAVAAWQKDKIFYLVNMTPFSVETTLYMDAATKASRADAEGELLLRDGAANIPLMPFELLVFNVDRNEAVKHADAELNENDVARLRFLIESLEDQARTACRIAADEKCKRLDQRSKAERAALSRRAVRELLRLIEVTEGQTITLGD